MALGTVLNKLVPGESTDLLIDLPSLRLPRLDNVVRKTGIKVWDFMKEVTAVLRRGHAVLSACCRSPARSTWIIEVAQPLVGRLAADCRRRRPTAFVMGFVRRDFGAAGFFTMNLTDPQLLVAMVTITLFVPCIASMMVVLKERGWAYMLGLFAGSIDVRVPARRHHRAHPRIA